MNGKSVLMIVGGVFLIFGGEVVKISEWREVLTPTFIGALLVQVGGLVGSIVGAYRVIPNGSGK